MSINLNSMLSRILEGDDVPGAIPVQAIDQEQIKKQEKDTFQHLDNAAKYAEFDCVTFGLETDDGAIVKVYVKTEDAEKFEEALSELLGKVDDIEEALNQIGQEFDIVDVEWPEDEEDIEDTENTDPALNKEVYDNANKEKDGQKLNNKLPDSDVTEGMRFANSISEGAVSYVMAHNRVTKEVVYILGEFGVTLDSEMFVTMLKKVHSHAIKNLSDDDKTAIIQFAHRIRLIASNKAIPVSDKNAEQVEESYDFNAKFKSKLEHSIFAVIQFLILGKDGNDLAAFIKSQKYSDFVQIVKTSKFKQSAYRQALKNLLLKINVNESVFSGYDALVEDKSEKDKKPEDKKSVDKKVETKKPEVKKPEVKKVVAKTSKPADKAEQNREKSLSSVEKTRKADFEKSDSYQELASKDKNIKLAVDILKWMGFSDDVLDSSTVKMELRHGVRSRIKRIMGTPEAKRVKMLWNYELEKKIEESKWTDTDDLVTDDEDVKISASDLKKPSVIGDKFSLPDSVHYKPWKFSSNKEEATTTFNNGKTEIVFSDESFEKIVKAINDEKKAFVVKDTEDTKWVFTTNEEGGMFVVQQGKTDKLFITPLDIENLLK